MQTSTHDQLVLNINDVTVIQSCWHSHRHPDQVLPSPCVWRSSSDSRVLSWRRECLEDLAGMLSLTIRMAMWHLDATTTKRRNMMSNQYKHFQSHGHIKKRPTIVVSLMLIACLVCGDNAMLIFCLCWPTVTLHQDQGQGHQNEREHICQAQVYHHAKIECHSLNTVRDMAIIVETKHVKFEMQLWPWVKNKVIRLTKDYKDL